MKWAAWNLKEKPFTSSLKQGCDKAGIFLFLKVTYNSTHNSKEIHVDVLYSKDKTEQ